MIRLVDSHYQFERTEVPVKEDVAKELGSLWGDIFKTDYSGMMGVLEGQESDFNTDIIYLARHNGRIVATTHLTVSRDDPRLGGFGEVATIAAHRGKGLARALSVEGAHEFDSLGGEALFLGTANPIAAKLYTSLGWQRLVRANVMLRTSVTLSPEEYLVDYFRDGAKLAVEVVVGSFRHRVPMIPLFLVPHRCIVLDAATSMLSIHVGVQKSCMSLYPRYEALDHRGAWFAATRSDGAVVGLASFKPVSVTAAQIDAFSHWQTPENLIADLYQYAIDFAAMRGVRKIQIPCAENDGLKQAVLTKLNMRSTQKMLQLEGADGPMALQLFEPA